MPSLVSSKHFVAMSEDEDYLYRVMAEQLVIDLPKGEITAANAAVLSGKLAQMANGAIYQDDGNICYIHDRKLDALEDII